MKIIRNVLIFFLFICLCAGCGAETQPELLETKATEPTAAETVAKPPEEASTHAYIRPWMEEEILEVFEERNWGSWLAVDCVSITDSEYGIVGAVQFYAEVDAEPLCYIGFVTSDGMIKQYAVQGSPVGQGSLKYIEGDMVRFQYYDPETGDCVSESVSYWRDEKGNDYFESTE